MRPEHEAPGLAEDSYLCSHQSAYPAAFQAWGEGLCAQEATRGCRTCLGPWNMSRRVWTTSGQELNPVSCLNSPGKPRDGASQEDSTKQRPQLTGDGHWHRSSKQAQHLELLGSAGCDTAQPARAGWGGQRGEHSSGASQGPVGSVPTARQ